MLLSYWHGNTFSTFDSSTDRERRELSRTSIQEPEIRELNKIYYLFFSIGYLIVS